MDFLSYRSLLVCLLAVVLLCKFVPSARAQATPTKQELITQLENYYVELYSEPLSAKGRLPKLLAIMSLSKLQAERTTSVLMELTANKDKVVRYLAWEVIHARHNTLTAEQKQAWINVTAEMAANGDFPGATLEAPLRILMSLPRDAFKVDIL